MNNVLLKKIKKIYEDVALPGEEAQSKMAPFSRMRKASYAKEIETAKRSAVLALLQEVNNKLHIVLIQRPSYNGVHGGQISFPGGKAEPTDVNLEHTALRETFEEIGITKEHIEMVGPLTDLYIPPSKFYVQPFLGCLKPNHPSFIPEKREVDEVLVLPLSEFRKKTNIQTRQLTTADGLVVKFPCYYIQKKVIWGATATVISEILALISDKKSQIFT